jgi:hypothetical protein
MENFTIMDMLDSKTNLSEPIEDLILIEKLFVFLFLGNCFGKISALGELHDNFEFILFGDVDFNEFDDVRMVEVFEDLGFFNGLVSLLLRHVIDVHFLDDKELIVSFSLDEIGFTKSSFSQ